MAKTKIIEGKKICSWCEEKPTMYENANSCKDCHIEGLRKIGWSGRDLAIAKWGAENGHTPGSQFAFGLLEKEEQNKILENA